MKYICCFALALSLPLGALTAQEERALTAGARVRLNVPKADCTYPEMAPCYRRVVGSLESVDSATIRVRSEDGDTVRVARAPSTRLEVNTRHGVCGGRRPECVFLGLASGVAVGAPVGAIMVASQGGANSCIDCPYVFFATLPAGALIGTVVGLALPGDEWEGADDPVRLTMGPDRSGRFALGLSLRF